MVEAFHTIWGPEWSPQDQLMEFYRYMYLSECDLRARSRAPIHSFEHISDQHHPLSHRLLRACTRTSGVHVSAEQKSHWMREKMFSVDENGVSHSRKSCHAQDRPSHVDDTTLGITDPDLEAYRIDSEWPLIVQCSRGHPHSGEVLRLGHDHHIIRCRRVC